MGFRVLSMARHVSIYTPGQQNLGFCQNRVQVKVQLQGGCRRRKKIGLLLVTDSATSANMEPFSCATRKHFLLKLAYMHTQSYQKA